MTHGKSGWQEAGARSARRQAARHGEAEANHLGGCVLHVVGDIAGASTGALPVCLDRRTTNVGGSGGVRCVVSEHPPGDLTGQVSDAIKFLVQFHDDLRRITSHAGCKDAFLDFANENRLDDETVAVQVDYLPAELLALAGELDIGVMLSLYPRSLPPIAAPPRLQDDPVAK